MTKLVFAASVFSGGLFLIYVVFISKSRRYQFVFSPANKMYFICSKEVGRVPNVFQINANSWIKIIKILLQDYNVKVLCVDYV